MSMSAVSRAAMMQSSAHDQGRDEDMGDPLSQDEMQFFKDIHQILVHLWGVAKGFSTPIDLEEPNLQKEVFEVHHT